MKRSARTGGRARYERGTSDCRATGDVSVGNGVWWSADLIVAKRRKDEILLTLSRHGVAGREGNDDTVDLCLRAADLEALPVLLSGVIAQARLDGVLPRRARPLTRSAVGG